MCASVHSAVDQWFSALEMLRCTYISCGSIVHWIRDTLYATVHLLLHIIVAMMKIGAPIKRNATNSAYCRSVAKSSVTAGTRANPYIQKIETIINWNYHFVTCVLCVCVQYFDVSAILQKLSWCQLNYVADALLCTGIGACTFVERDQWHLRWLRLVIHSFHVIIVEMCLPH